MVGRPGTTQNAFTAGELDPGLIDNLDIKYRSRGLKTGTNVEPIPQGGFKLADGLRLRGDVSATAMRLFPFTASDGTSYDIVAAPNFFYIWGADGLLDTVATPYSGTHLRQLEIAQQYDTAILFHSDIRPRRLRILAPDNWVLDDAPFTGIPNYDYGGTYVNGVPAEWTIDFSAALDGSLFILTISREESSAISWATGTVAAVRNAIDASMAAMPQVRPGYAVTVLSATSIHVVFSGSGNEGDGWAISGAVKNKPDSAIIAYKDVVGVPPGEPVMSSERGWPRCGAFYLQRLLIGGFKSLPNAWLMSIQGDYFNLDDRIGEANGSALIPMDLPGGEAILKMVAARNLLIFTNSGQYWLQDRALSKTTAPSHVKAGNDGVRAGVPVCENDGAVLIVFNKGATVGEFRYNDSEGNFGTAGISILSAHLIAGVRDTAIRRPSTNSDGSLFVLVRDDGQMRIAKLLRAQDVTAFVRRAVDGVVLAVTCNERDEISIIVERTSAHGPQRTLEQLDPFALLDCTEYRSFDPPQATISGLARHDGREVWVIGDDEVYGPFLVDDGSLTLPVAVAEAQIGRWQPPVAELLPPSRAVGGGMVLKRKGRIHSARLSLTSTTSLAIGANGGAAKEVPLRHWGDMELPSLQARTSGSVTVRGLTNYVDEPTLTITQKRPGRLHVLSVTPEAKL